VLAVSWPVALLIAFAITQVANVVTTLYLHRALAHRSVQLSPAVELLFRTVMWLTIGIDRQEWVAVHRKHHVYSDEPPDPHSPIQKGVWNVFAFNVGYYRVEAKKPDTVDTYARDLAPDRIERLLFSHGFAGVGIGLVALALLFGPFTALLIGVAHVVLYIGLSGAVNGFGHWFGAHPHDNKATNLRWLALLTAGEGMHNEHHEFPRSPRFGSTWWDLGGKLAGLLSRLGVARLHDSSRLRRDSEPVGAVR
jgi:stearoyl-CoA desaturase (Delta-9 desaturase)